VFDPNHVLLDLPQVGYEGEMLAEPKRILEVNLQHLTNSSFQDPKKKSGKTIMRMRHHGR
jgi:hypothetical protein